MIDHFRQNLSTHWRETVGFALFLAWVYCALFGCGLATVDETLMCAPSSYGLEYIWMMCGLFEAVGAIAGIVVARKLPQADELLQRRHVALAAAVLAAAGAFFIWLAWYDRVVLFDRVFVVGSALTGFAIVLFTVIWSARLRRLNEARLEFVIPCSFTISFLLYFVILLTKESGLVVLALVIVMNFASMRLARTDAPAPSAEAAEPCAGKAPCGNPGMRSFVILAFASWVQIAFFRVISTPALSGNRFTHYLIPFSFACVLSLAMLLLCIRMSRYLNVSLAYRWSLPLFMLSYVPIIVDYGNPGLRILAYAINFLGMFGVQFGCWIGACKYLRRMGCKTTGLFSRYALGEGAGIFVGSLIGLVAVKALDGQGIMTLSFVLMSLVVFVAMATGFNPSWVFYRSPSARRRRAEGPEEGANPCADLEAIFQGEAADLQSRFGLTERETDVAALLLAGRSRPFIRDELTVSINTVSSHVRSIFSKCDVHSQQELIDLARGGAAPKPAPAAE
ncbi:helix-turn-helix transcriptional regulator [Eggerthella sp. NSJ-70]|uniref:Helix-turn-helix transcriptional regulator n=1 Tax=Eggerthella hominis TaxID=2763043 RepID=A0ABR7BMK4_9ACTN|nr:helix-turn-helix transcriptional regulator [Eggerthella hominis]MBC5582839.1 helix-turn-helix transcriptional regulator [Eggerthella hominis]